MKAITYIGRRQCRNDVTYGTGEWATGQTKLVQDATALKMLRHTDSYAHGDDKQGEQQEAVETVVEKEKKEIEEDQVQDLLVSIQTMGVDAIAEFVQRHFNQKIDRRKSAENLRIDAVNLLHQFGPLE
jgi:hypothetical protein